jgi:hypothetical protein
MTAMVWILRGNQRQSRVLILEQDDAAFFDFARNFEAGEGIDDAALAGIIDDAGGKHGAQDAVHMLVQFGDGMVPASTAAL